MLGVCSKAIQTPRVVEEQRFSAGVEGEEESATGGQSTESAAEGANRVPPPVTPGELQWKDLDENVDDALNLDADRLPVQSPFSNARSRSRSPQNVSRGGADGGIH